MKRIIAIIVAIFSLNVVHAEPITITTVAAGVIVGGAAIKTARCLWNWVMGTPQQETPDQKAVQVLTAANTRLSNEVIQKQNDLNLMHKQLVLTTQKKVISEEEKKSAQDHVYDLSQELLLRKQELLAAYTSCIYDLSKEQCTHLKDLIEKEQQL